MSRYIVTFSDEVSNASDVDRILSSAEIKYPRTIVEQESPTQAEGFDKKVTYLRHLGIAIMSLDDEEASSVRRLDDVSAVEEDLEIRALGVPKISPSWLPVSTAATWNMEMIRADLVWRTGTFGTRIKVAIIDTGIAWHPNLQTYGGVSFVQGVSSYNDDNGHGTHCAGIVAGKGRNGVFGVAPGAELFAVKVLDGNGSGYNSWVLSGMNWCVDAGMKVASMSLGSNSPPQVAYSTAIKRCQSSGTVVVCAAGNSFGGTFPWVNSPANSLTPGDEYTQPIAVASVNSGKVVASTSSRGANGADWNQVTVAAPGVSIYSTYLNAGYATMSGTSMACPHVAGLAALVLERYPNISPTLVKALIVANAQPLGNAPFPNEPYGAGLIDCASATGVVTLKSPEELCKTAVA